MSTTSHKRTTWSRALAIGAIASIAVAILALAFLWPARYSTPHHLPLSIAGAASDVTALENRLTRIAPETFAVVSAADRDEASKQVATRRTIGAVILSPDTSIEVLTASAAGSAQAQALRTLASLLDAGGDQGGEHPSSVTVSDVAPLTPSDPGGAVLTASAFPLALGGVVAGILLALLVHGTRQRFSAAVVFAAVSGSLITSVLQPWFGIIQGNFWLNYLAISLTILATASFMIGLVKLIGKPGIGIAAVITMLIGNPLSGATMPWQFIPAPWGLLGQFMVPGAGSSLLRSLSYFPSAPTWPQWMTLCAWIAIGSLLAACGHAHHAVQRRNASAIAS